MRNRRVHRAAGGGADSARRAAAAGIPRLRQRRAWPPAPATSCTCARRPGGSPNWRKLVATQPGPGLLGISHTRWATHGRATDAQRPPAPRRRRPSSPWSTTASSRTTPPSSSSSKPRASSSAATPTPKCIAQLIAHYSRRRPRRGRAQGAAAAQGHLRPGGRSAREPGPDRRRAAGQPAGRRRRRRARTSWPATRPPWRATPTRSSTCNDRQLCVLTADDWHILDQDRAPVSTPRPRHRLGDRRRRQGRLRALHAQGDLRAARGAGERHARPARRRRRHRPLRRPEPRRRSSCARSSASS